MTLSNTNNNANNSFVHYTTSALTIVHAYILEAVESDSGIDFHIHSSANTVRVIGISECYKFPASSAPLPWFFVSYFKRKPALVASWSRVRGYEGLDWICWLIDDNDGHYL